MKYEIKGISTNVKKNNISQLDDHYCNYIDNNNLSPDQINKVKQLLIINHQRQVKLEERQPVSKDVIDKAKNNCSLIIETKTLLKIYELYLQNKITSDDIFNMFLKDGLLEF